MRVGLLVEDHRDARAWLERTLQTAFPSIKLASKGTLAEGLASIEHFSGAGIAPDIALVDLGLPDGSGLELIRVLRARSPSCLVVVASRYEGDAHLFAALKAGAQGYLLKQQPQADLIRRLEGIANGEPPLSPAVAARLLSAFGPDSNRAGFVAPVDKPPRNPLTGREREVLSMLTTGVTLEKAGALLGISRHTVAAHVKRIYEKLEISSRAEAIMEAVRLGLTDE